MDYAEYCEQAMNRTCKFILALIAEMVLGHNLVYTHPPLLASIGLVIAMLLILGFMGRLLNDAYEHERDN